MKHKLEIKEIIVHFYVYLWFYCLYSKSASCAALSKPFFETVFLPLQGPPCSLKP